MDLLLFQNKLKMENKLDELRDRLKMVFQTLNIKGVDFSEATGFSTGYISMILNPDSNKPVTPSTRFYRAAQREFNINPEWLEKGEGEMFCSEGNGLTPTQHQIIKKYYSISEESREVIDSILDRFIIADNLKTDEKDE